MALARGARRDPRLPILPPGAILERCNYCRNQVEFCYKCIVSVSGFLAVASFDFYKITDEVAAPAEEMFAETNERQLGDDFERGAPRQCTRA